MVFALVWSHPIVTNYAAAATDVGSTSFPAPLPPAASSDHTADRPHIGWNPQLLDFYATFNISAMIWPLVLCRGRTYHPAKVPVRQVCEPNLVADFSYWLDLVLRLGTLAAN